MEEEIQPLEPPPLLNSKCINAEWIASMLSAYHGKAVTLLSHHCSFPEGKSGFNSEIAFVSLTYEVDDKKMQEKFVFKFLPIQNKAKLFVRNGKLAKREVDFYKFAQSEEFKLVCVRSGYSLVVPDVIYSQFTESCFTLVLRDLNFNNYKTLIPRNGSNIEQTLKAFTSIAVVHAAGLFYFEKHGHFEIDKYEDYTFMNKRLESNLLTLSKIFKGNHLADVFLALVPLKKEINMYSQKHPLYETVIHGDLWAGQCMFSADENEVCILDWQFSAIGNPVKDLMGMFFMSSDTKVLENHCEEVLSHYWKVFTANLDKNKVKFTTSFSDFLENFEKHWMTGFQFIALSLSDFLGEDSISSERLHGLMHFLDKKNVFNEFIKELRITSI